MMFSQNINSFCLPRGTVSPVGINNPTNRQSAEKHPTQSCLGWMPKVKRERERRRRESDTELKNKTRHHCQNN